ncbi:MAG TPA: hypothetical protein ENG89_02040 [Candidatus Moranbacteria bacterium]|nr:hypothetical protein [Candidatus Moranbacteria bacterium]
MISNFYFKIPRRLRVFIIFILIILAAYLITRIFFVEPKTVPNDFLRARQEASLIAKDIVNLSNESAGNINEIYEFDREGNYKEALNLLANELERNRQAREKAIELSAQLEKMARAVSEISPISASQSAIQAISSETTLISRLITYNDYLFQLLEVLRSKFLGKTKNSSELISELISKINEEVQAINELDRKFNEVMKEFDREF